VASFVETKKNIETFYVYLSLIKSFDFKDPALKVHTDC